MLRPKINSKIYSVLNSSTYFKASDFKIEIEEQYGDAVVTITYEYEEKYNIELRIPNSKTEKSRKETSQNAFGQQTTKTIEYTVYEIKGKMSPGILAHSEDFINEGENGIACAINAWLKNLWEDITIAPELRQFNSQQEEIEKIKERVNGMPNEYFTVEEGEELKSRLDKLESQLTEKLNTENPDASDAEKQINKLHSEIEVLKQTIFSLKKPGWFKSFITKTMTWLSNPTNQKLLKAGKDLVVTMLPEGTKGSNP
ncbi:MAG: hypothetical protein BGO70_08970 [Bacteroidetes bacterium 43-93]|nr:hypothetical protein [Bacteroidota bacterium]OJX00297.1 MAG: hypothetical protein BGO70_08970 [Bacteroidetes bacterium 43-93]